MAGSIGSDYSVSSAQLQLANTSQLLNQTLSNSSAFSSVYDSLGVYSLIQQGGGSDLADYLLSSQGIGSNFSSTG